MKKYALIGEGISYTLSPKLHACISDVTGRACSYDVIDVGCDELEAARARLLGYDGYNVTKPFKQAMLGVALVGEAKAIGVVNTVMPKTNEGYNTDCYGLREALRQGNMFPAAGARVLVLGAGGAARAAMYALRHCNLTVSNRSIEKARLACEALGVQARVVDRESTQGEYDLIVNATTLGLQGEDCVPEGVCVSKGGACFDMIYAPQSTPFLQWAEAQGARTQNGLRMLVLQAIRAREIWENAPITECEVQRILERML